MASEGKSELPPVPMRNYQCGHYVEERVVHRVAIDNSRLHKWKYRFIGIFCHFLRSHPHLIIVTSRKIEGNYKGNYKIISLNL